MGLTTDPDTAVPYRIHRDPRVLGTVLVGGALGTGARYGLGSAFPTPDGTWPWTIFTVNLLGAFALGLLLDALARSGVDEGWRRTVRVGVGTGVLGGFTTYSTFAVEVDQLVRGGHLALAAGYAVASVVLGTLAATLGAALAGVMADRRRRPSPATSDEGARS